MTIRLTVPCLVVLAGASGAGKSTFAAQHFTPAQVVSSDELRSRVGIDESDQRASKDAFAALDLIVAARLARKLTTVIDTLGLDPAQREHYIEMARTSGMPVYAIWFDTDPAECRSRNKAKRRPVPAKVLSKQLETATQLETDLATEDFDGVFRATHDLAQVGPDFATADELATRQRRHPVKLDFGLMISRFAWPEGPEGTRDRLRSMAGTAEAAGFTSVWVMDHFIQIPQVGQAWDDMLDSYTTLSYLAGVTERVKLGVLVTGVTYRNPAHLGKIIATLDVLSGGRAICGLGAAWYEREHDAYGWEFPELRDRYRLLEDTIHILRAMWGPGTPAYEGTAASVAEANSYPRPLQDHIPLMIGGGGEKKTLRLVAEHADMCNLFGDPDTVRHKLKVLRSHCDDVGRDPTEIGVTHLSSALVSAGADEQAAWIEENRPANTTHDAYAARMGAGLVEDQIGRYRALADAGVGTAIVALPDHAEVGAIERFGHVIEAFGGT